MIELFFWILSGFWMAEALFACLKVAFFARRMRRERDLWGRCPVEDQRSAVVVLAVKGFDPEHTPPFFEALFSQEYRRYRVIVAAESADDPVVPWLKKRLGLGAEEWTWAPAPGRGGLTGAQIIVAGLCRGRGQKVHNQVRAFAELEPGDAIVAFADADIRCGRDWLAKLAAPINAGTHSLSSTYRWLIPRRATLVNAFASVINASVATLGGQETWNQLWGGSMAIGRPDFDDLDVPGLFSGSLNDDLRLGKAARRSGRRMAYVRDLLMPSPVDFTWAGFFEFARRQYYQVRFFSPIFYRLSLLLTWGNVLGLAAALVALGVFRWPLAWLPLAFVAVCDQARALGRWRLCRELFDGETLEALRVTRPVEHLATPLWMLAHGIASASALFTDRIGWAGVDYRVVAADRTEVLGRGSVAGEE